MDEKRTCYFSILPFEVVEYHIVPHLLPSSIMACLFVNRRLSKLCSKIVSNFTRSRVTDILEHLFLIGSTSLIIWFRETIHYPVFIRIKVIESLQNSAKGKFIACILIISVRSASVSPVDSYKFVFNS